MGPRPLRPKEIDGLLRKSGSSQTIHTYKPYWLSWAVIFKALFKCHDILLLCKSLIKMNQRPDMTFAVDWGVKR